MYLILMGGFLGAGKTTAINHAAALLQGRAHQVSVITNDQGSQLVDTKFAEGNGYNVSEVIGGCFCCNFDKLEQLVTAIMSGHGSEIILAESVGSCTDLVATVIKPMKREHKNIRISLSVFVDGPAMWSQWQAHKYIYKPTIEYIFEKQLEEADIIILNKVDLMSQQNLQKLMDAIKDKYPAKEVVSQNSNDSNDIERWLQLVLKGIEPHRDSLLIDYDAYAAGEAELAWLDGEISIKGAHSVVVANRLIKSIKSKIDENEWPIGHIKFLYNGSEGLQKVSITAVSSPNIKLFVGDNEQVILLLNARVQCEPSQLYNLLQNTVTEMNEGSATHLRLMNIDYFKPGYPRPTHRMTVAKNKVIGISYTLFDGQGNLLEDNEGYAPILYLHGRGNIIQELETALEGLKVGDVKEVGINKNLPTVPIDSEEESSLPLFDKSESESLLYKVRVVLVRDSTLAEINSGFPLPESWCSQQPGCC